MKRSHGWHLSKQICYVVTAVLVLFWPRKTIVHNMSLLTWLNISQAKLLYEILQIRFNGRRFALLYNYTTNTRFFGYVGRLCPKLTPGFIMALTFRQGKSLSNKINTHTVKLTLCSKQQQLLLSLYDFIKFKRGLTFVYVTD